jgi:hypothetical protein
LRFTEVLFAVCCVWIVFGFRIAMEKQMSMDPSLEFGLELGESPVAPPGRAPAENPAGPKPSGPAVESEQADPQASDEGLAQRTPREYEVARPPLGN